MLPFMMKAVKHLQPTNYTVIYMYSETSIIRTSIIRTLDYPNASPRSTHNCANILATSIIRTLDYPNVFSWSQRVRIIEVALYIQT